MSVDPVRVVVFAEDSAWWARDVLRALLVEMVRGLWRPPVNLHDAFTFVADDEIGVEVHRLSVGCGWKEKHKNATAFVRSLTDLLRTGCVVVIHFDADCLWSERRRQDENRDNRAKFRRLIYNRLKENPPAADWHERLLLFVPHDELEAWLFQNTVAAKALLHDAKRLDQPVAALLDGWANDRASLDRAKSPKDLLAVGGLSLVPLAGNGFPPAEVRALGTSYAKAMARGASLWPLRRAVLRLVTRARRQARQRLGKQPLAQRHPMERP
ncbi:MAG: hypothetical protein IPN01_38120 [Deltaproteobacteria bacterium]|nr:hypothetical protein [Deltaproteobacteria bacterium]